MSDPSFFFYFYRVNGSFPSLAGCHEHCKHFQQIAALRHDVQRNPLSRKILVCDEESLVEVILRLGHRHWANIFILTDGEEHFDLPELADADISPVRCPEERVLIYRLLAEAIRRHQEDNRRHQAEGNNSLAFLSGTRSLELIRLLVEM